MEAAKRLNVPPLAPPPFLQENAKNGNRFWENAENVCIVAFGGCPKMHADENAHIVANPSAAGTDWGVSWCARECLYSSKSGRRRHRMEGEGAAGTDWEGRAPQAADGGGCGGGSFSPPTT